jgi:hypothetical protein
MTSHLRRNVLSKLHVAADHSKHVSRLRGSCRQRLYLTVDPSQASFFTHISNRTLIHDPTATQALQLLLEAYTSLPTYPT